MAFHEKSAWLMSLALLIATGLYFGSVLSLSAAAGQWIRPDLPSLLIPTFALMAVIVAGHILIAALSPRDVQSRPDEREQVIRVKAGNVSRYVLASGVVLALGIYLMSANGNLLFYGVVASLLLANLAEFLLQIVYYRLGRF